MNAMKKTNDERHKSHKSRIGREETDKQMAVGTVRKRSCNNIKMVYQYLTTGFGNLDKGS